MALLTAGYWPTTYWADSYWHEDYWQDYGVGGPSPPARKHWFFGPIVQEIIFGGLFYARTKKR